MREIKFRGKRLDNGEWVSGYLVHADLIRQAGLVLSTKDMSTEGEFNCRVFRVDPSTVGQFTGLKDKNGREIWEGDIIKATVTLYFADDPDNDELQDIIVPVIFQDGAFLVDISFLNTDLDYELVSNLDCEVIGNTTDNPEEAKK